MVRRLFQSLRDSKDDDIEKQLRRLEEKIDRVLREIEHLQN